MPDFLVAIGAWHFDDVEQISRSVGLPSIGAIVRVGMVLGCYLLWNVAYVIMMVQGRREKSFGMPPIGAAAVLAICIIALVGPFSNQSHLFYYKENYVTLTVWIISLVLQGGVFLQYLAYGRDHRRLIPELNQHFFVVSLGTLAALVITFWTFVVFYQDYYVNEICPIAVLICSIAYFPTLYTRPNLRGLSVAVGWMLAIGNLLLDAAVVLGDMTDPYPEVAFGYTFIYWIYFLTLVLNFTYAIILTRRHRWLKANPAAALATAGA